MPMSTSSIQSTALGSTKSGSSIFSRRTQLTQAVDFTHDITTSPIELESAIQAERLTKILDSLLYKTKVAICFPKLVHSYDILNSILENCEKEDLFFIFAEYEKPYALECQINRSAIEDIKCGNFSMKNRVNPELGHLLQIMNSYQELRPVVEDMIEDMKAKYSMDKPKITNSALDYLLTLENFKCLMEMKLNMSATDELSAKINQRKLEEANRICTEKNEMYMVALKEENDTFVLSMEQKKETIAKLSKELDILSHESSKKMKEQIRQSDCQMVLASRAHTAKIAMVKEEDAKIQAAYEELLKVNLTDEQALRMRRCKVENHVLSWIQKYDLEMNDKQEELDEFVQKCEEEERMIKELQEKIAEQDLQYIPLMAEREEEYQQEMQAKMLKFRMDHSARVIQAAWKRVLKNREEKKKLKRQQKQLQDALRKQNAH